MRIDVKVLKRTPYNKQGNIVALVVPKSPQFFSNDDIATVEINRLYISVDTYNTYRQAKEEITALKQLEDEAHKLYSQVVWLTSKIDIVVVHHEAIDRAKDAISNITRLIEFKEDYIKQVEAGRYNV